MNGVLSSATLLLTTTCLESTVNEIVRPTGIPVGIHLSLTLGRCCAGPEQVRSLVDEGGRFIYQSPGSLFRDLMRARQDSALLSDIKREFSAQFERAFAFKMEFTHFDSHQHVHMIPSVFAILGDLAKRFGLKKARFVSEPFHIFPLYTRPFGIIKRNNLLKWALMRFCTSRIGNTFQSPNCFFGLMCSGILNKKLLLQFINKTRPGLSYEVGLHPGLPSDGPDADLSPTVNEFVGSSARTAEYNLLVDAEIRSAIEERSVKLASFRDL